MGSRFKFFRTVYYKGIKHTQKGFPEDDLKTTFSFDDDVIYKIPLKYRYRPDLIAARFYNDPKLFWVLVYANGFYNSPEDFESDAVIRVPRYEKVIGLL